MSDQFSHGYALLIGVGECDYAPWSLPATVKDIDAIKSVLVDPNLCAYSDDSEYVRMLHDETASHDGILDGLGWLEEQSVADPHASVVVHFSGHGWVDKGSGLYYLITHDANPSDTAGSALPAQKFSAAIRAIKAQRLLVFLDCCHSEGMATARGSSARQLPDGFRAATPPTGLVEDLKQGEGRAIFTSSRGTQSSWELPDRSLGIYTHHLLEALQGAGNKPGDRMVHVSHLMTHLARSVPATARKHWQVDQTPFFDTAAEDFPVAILRGGRGLPAGGWEAVQPEAAETIQRIVQAIGDRSLPIGGDVKDSIIVTGDATVEGDIVGRDKIVHGDVVRGDKITVTTGFGGEDIDRLFTPLTALLIDLPPAIRDDALEEVEALKAEVEKGDGADDSRIAALLDGLVKLVPGAVSMIASTFASPILAGVTGPVTKYVLERLRSE